MTTQSTIIAQNHETIQEPQRGGCVTPIGLLNTIVQGENSQVSSRTIHCFRCGKLSHQSMEFHKNVSREGKLLFI